MANLSGGPNGVFASSAFMAALGSSPQGGTISPKPTARQATFGPDSGFVIPPVDTFSGRYNIANRNYYVYFDEALRDSRENTLVMRRDGFIHELLRHRQYPIVSLPRHIEVDDPDDDGQKAVAETVGKIISAIPRLKTLLLTLMEAIFYGQYGIQMTYASKLISGKKYNTVSNFTPINGDKIRYKFDGTPGIAIRSGAQSDPDPNNAVLVEYRDFVQTTMLGPALFLEDNFLKDRFIIHKFEPSDTDYLYEIDEAQSAIGGVGLRSRLYWVWNIRTEIMSWVIDALQRVGANGMIYGFYPEGDVRAQAAMLQALQMLVKDNISVFPVVQGSGQPPFQRIEPAKVGHDIMLRLIEMLDGIMRRAVLGQDLSSHSAPTGLGSGTAKLQASVRGDVIAYDATCLSDTLTDQLLGPILRYNEFEYNGKLYRGDELPFSMRVVIQVDDEKIAEKIAAATQLAALGVELDGDDLRDIAGLSPPRKDASKVGGKSMMTKDEFKRSIPGLGKADAETRRFVDSIYEIARKSNVLPVSRHDCGHDRDGDFSHGNTCACKDCSKGDPVSRMGDLDSVPGLPEISAKNRAVVAVNLARNLWGIVKGSKSNYHNHVFKDSLPTPLRSDIYDLMENRSEWSDASIKRELDLIASTKAGRKDIAFAKELYSHLSGLVESGAISIKGGVNKHGVRYSSISVAPEGTEGREKLEEWIDSAISDYADAKDSEPKDPKEPPARSKMSAMDRYSGDEVLGHEIPEVDPTIKGKILSRMVYKVLGAANRVKISHPDYSGDEIDDVMQEVFRDSSSGWGRVFDAMSMTPKARDRELSDVLSTRSGRMAFAKLRYAYESVGRLADKGMLDIRGGSVVVPPVDSVYRKMLMMEVKRSRNK